MITCAVRGAVQLERDDREEFCAAVNRLVATLLARNTISESDIVSVVFSQTRDLVSANPAACLRRSGYSDTALFCTQEPEYPDSLPRVVRVLITFNTEAQAAKPEPAYLDGAEQLRPDIAARYEQS